MFGIKCKESRMICVPQNSTQSTVTVFNFMNTMNSQNESYEFKWKMEIYV